MSYLPFRARATRAAQQFQSVPAAFRAAVASRLVRRCGALLISGVLTSVLPLAALTDAPTGTISGRAVDAQGAAVPGASVELVDLRRRAVSEADGAFRFEAVPVGEHLLSVESARRGSASTRVVVRDGADSRIEVALDLAVHSEEIVVSAGPEARTAREAYQPAQVLDGLELQALIQPTLGETLSQQPGISSTAFGQGASRPVIRGFGGDRVRVLENGVGVGDVSDTSPDHAVASDPSGAESLEILRGPATLMYGSSAEGGVVNVINDRIPRFAATSPLNGHADLRYGSAADERSGNVDLNGGGGNLAWHLDGFRRATDDYDSANGRVENSDLSASGANAGFSWLGKDGYLGVSAGRFDTEYGNPAEEAVRIDLQQRRYDLQGELNRALGFLTALKVRVGHNDYEHTELEDGQVGTVFLDNGWEGRVEAVQRQTGLLRGSFGLQVKRRDFEAVGEEAFVRASRTESWAGFLFEEVGRGAFRAQLGLRHEAQDVDIDSDELPDRSFGDTSGSLSGIWLHGDYAVALTASRSVKLPNAVELYAFGPHIATNAWEIGDSGLSAEKGVGIDLSLRKTAGRLHGELSFFENRIDGFIYEQFSDEPVPSDDEEFRELQVIRFAQDDATFRGAELHLDYDLLHVEPYHLTLELTGDLVRAELRSTGEPLPRIPPRRLGVALRFGGQQLGASIESYSVSRQDRVSALETETPGYSMFNAEVSFRIFADPLVHDFVLRGTNLTDQLALNHVSYLKDVAPLPGRGVTLSYRLGF